MADQENSTLQTPLPPVKRSKSLVVTIGVIILALIVIAVLAFWFKHKAANPISTTVTQSPGSQTTTPPALTLSQEQVLVDSHSKLTFPQISASSSVNSSLLPKDLSVFILASSGPVSVNQLTFADGSQGYSIAYNQPGQPDNVDQQFFLLYENKNSQVEQAGYSIVSGITTELVARLEQQNLKYQIRIDMDAFEGNSAVNIIVREIK